MSDPNDKSDNLGSDDSAGESSNIHNNSTQQVQQTINKAIEFCRNSDNVSFHEKDRCIQTTGSALFIDQNAFAICKQQPSHRRVDCIESIVNKKYEPAIIEECKATSEYYQVECLSKYGAPVVTSITIVVKNEIIQQGSIECEYENIYGRFPAGGGCNTFGCWTAGGGCNTFGCWTAGGGCNTFGCWTAGGYCGALDCVNETTSINVCQ